uniref:C2H2-type domain-containing protein n=1 Tax=viral metagenome TaxID=1070528 RepID=A0A6C0ISD0_9ZZZZ
MSDWQRHNETMKHFKNKEKSHINQIHNSEKILDVNQCNKCMFICKSRSGLWKHKQKCGQQKSKKNINDYINQAVNEAFKDFIKEVMQNKDDKQYEIMTQLIQNQSELQSVVKDIVKSGIMTNSHNTNTNTNTNTINSHNKTFNLQMYLNETCKDAMNLSEFVNNIVPTIEELEKTAREGYVKGVTSIVNTRLDEVDKNNQPIHCTDGKREILYIKENDIWNKEDGDDKPLLLRAIKSVARKNICNISEWIKLYPDCTQSDSRKNDMYLKIMLNAMSGGTEEECKTNYEKIVSAVAKHTIIEKTC